MEGMDSGHCTIFDDVIILRTYCFNTRGFHKPAIIQWCQYPQLWFGCAIRNELDKWSLQHWNVTSDLTLLKSYGANKEGNC